MDYKKKYEQALTNARQEYNTTENVERKQWLEELFPELKESEDERIRKEIIRFIRMEVEDEIVGNKWLAWLEKQKEPELSEDLGEYVAELSKQFPEVSFAKLSRIAVRVKNWLEKQGNTDLEFFENGENEKREFVGYGFLKCKGDFLSFKEGETYWLEYVGKDNYNVRSDNLLGQTFHITPQQLYIVFRPTTWLEKQGQKKCIDDLTQQEAMDIAVAKCFEQGEQKFEMKSAEESLDMSSEEYNDIVNECLYGESNSSDKVEPKFKVGDKIRRKIPRIYDKDMQVARIGKDYYLCNNLGKFSSEQISFSEESNYELVEQKPVDKVEPKFHEGDWVVCEAGEFSSTLQINNIKNGYYWFNDDSYLPVVDEDCLHLWTIQDAKDGDVLVFETDEVEWVLIYKEIVTSSSEVPHDLLRYYLLLADNYCNWRQGVCGMVTEDYEDYEEYLKPATKEQRNLLFSKMKEAGYAFDFENKKLNEIKQEDEEYNGEDYGIDSLYHAQRILEKTLGEVDGYQTDDGILDHKCAISAVKKLYEQKPADWSEEDRDYYDAIITKLEVTQDDATLTDNQMEFLKSLKNRVHPKTEWGEEDEIKIKSIIAFLKSPSLCAMDGNKGIIDANIKYLKSIKDRVQPQSTWKPSDEQIKAIRLARSFVTDDFDEHPTLSEILIELEEQLKKLQNESN